MGDKRILVIMLALALLASCSDTKPFLRERAPVLFGRLEDRPNNNDVLTLYTLGDWGTGKSAQKAVAEGLRQNVLEIPTGRKVKPFVLGLGDNVYEHGLPEGWNNPETIALLERTFGDVYANVKYEGEHLTFHVVPGNHDYSGRAGGKDGYGDIIHQETTAESLYSYWKYYPIDPERNADSNDSTDYAALRNEDILTLTTPEKISAGGSRLAVFAIDTQVLLDLYDANDDERLTLHWRKLAALVSQSQADWKMVIGHHPIRSHGKHGGFIKGFWWIPPLTIYALVDKLFVKRKQDLDHPANREFQHDLQEFMEKHDITFYVAGHDHCLQFLRISDRHLQIVSGSAGKLAGVTHKKDTYYSHEAHGFTRFDLTPDEAWIEFFQVDPKKGVVSASGLFRVAK